MMAEAVELGARRWLKGSATPFSGRTSTAAMSLSDSSATRPRAIFRILGLDVEAVRLSVTWSSLGARMGGVYWNQSRLPRGMVRHWRRLEWELATPGVRVPFSAALTR